MYQMNSAERSQECHWTRNSVCGVAENSKRPTCVRCVHWVVGPLGKLFEPFCCVVVAFTGGVRFGKCSPRRPQFATGGGANCGLIFSSARKSGATLFRFIHYLRPPDQRGLPSEIVDLPRVPFHGAKCRARAFFMVASCPFQHTPSSPMQYLIIPFRLCVFEKRPEINPAGGVFKFLAPPGAATGCWRSNLIAVPPLTRSVRKLDHTQRPETRS